METRNVKIRTLIMKDINKIIDSLSPVEQNKLVNYVLDR